MPLAKFKPFRLMSSVFQDSPELKNWLSQNVYPVRMVHFVWLDRMPVLKRHNAISLGFVVLLRRSKFQPTDPSNKWIVETIIHELVHIRQQQRTLIIPWFVAYLLLWIFTGFSYRKNPLEIDAVRKAAVLIEQYDQEYGPLH